MIINQDFTLSGKELTTLNQWTAEVAQRMGAAES